MCVCVCVRAHMCMCVHACDMSVCLVHSCRCSMCVCAMYTPASQPASDPSMSTYIVLALLACAECAACEGQMWAHFAVLQPLSMGRGGGG